ncbi:MAG: pentapeptide repeat-containing protein [Pseudanabaena sp. ELA607]
MDVATLLTKYAAGERDFRRCDLGKSWLPGVNLGGINLTEADLNQTTLLRSDLEGAELSWTNLQNANLNGANLTRVNLSGASLRGAALRLAVLVEAVLLETDFCGACLVDADLRRTFLTGANLSGAQLQYADLRGAFLAGASLTGADLRGANLAGADLSRVNLTGANLAEANLTGATVINARLSWTNLAQVNLAGADLTNSSLVTVINLKDVLLSEVRNVVETVVTNQSGTVPEPPEIVAEEIPESTALIDTDSENSQIVSETAALDGNLDELGLAETGLAADLPLVSDSAPPQIEVNQDPTAPEPDQESITPPDINHPDTNASNDDSAPELPAKPPETNPEDERLSLRD